MTSTLCCALTQRVEDAAWVAVVAAALEETLQPCEAAGLTLALGLAVVHPPLSLHPSKQEELHYQQGACTGARRAAQCRTPCPWGQQQGTVACCRHYSRPSTSNSSPCSKPSLKKAAKQRLSPAIQFALHHAIVPVQLVLHHCKAWRQHEE